MLLSARMREYYISPDNQMHFPHKVRDRWNIINGESHVRTTDLGDGVLITPAGSALTLVQFYFPQSKLKNRAVRHQNTLSGVLGMKDPFDSPDSKLFKPYNISTQGRVVVPAHAVNRWNTHNSRAVKTVDLASGLLIMQSGDDYDVDERTSTLVPVETLEKGDLPYNTDEALSAHLVYAYLEWCMDLGRVLSIYAAAGVSPDEFGEKKDNTELERRIRQGVLSDALKTVE